MLVTKLYVALCITIGHAVSVSAVLHRNGHINNASSRGLRTSGLTVPGRRDNKLSSADPATFQEVFEPSSYEDSIQDHIALQSTEGLPSFSKSSHCWPLFVPLSGVCNPWPFAMLLITVLSLALVRMAIGWKTAAGNPESDKQMCSLEGTQCDVERRGWDAWCSFWCEDFKAFTHPEASRFVFFLVLLMIIFLDPIIGRADFASPLGAPYLLSQAPAFLRDPWPTAALWPFADGQVAFAVAYVVLALWLLSLLVLALAPRNSEARPGYLQAMLSSLLMCLALGSLWLQGLARGLIGCSHRYTALGIFWIGLALSEALALTNLLPQEKKDSFLRKWTLTTLVYTLFAGGIAKLVMTGPSWADGTVLELSMRERLTEPDGGLMSHTVSSTEAFIVWLLDHRSWTMPLMGFGALVFEIGCIVVLIPKLPWLHTLRWIFVVGLLGLFFGISSVLGITFWPQCCLVLLVVDIPALLLSCMKYCMHNAISQRIGRPVIPDAVLRSKPSDATGFVGLLFVIVMVSVVVLQAEAWPFSSIPMYAYKIPGLDEHCRFSSQKSFVAHIDFCTHFSNQPCLPWCAVQVQVGADALENRVAVSGDSFVQVKPTRDLPFAVGDVGKVLTVQWQTKLLTSVRQAALSQKWNFAQLAEAASRNDEMDSAVGRNSHLTLEQINAHDGPAAEELKALVTWLTGKQILCPASGAPLRARLLPRFISGVPDLILAYAEKEC